MPRDIHYYLDRGITSWSAIEQLEEAYYAGLSPKPVAAINYLRDGKKLKQFLARQQGLIDGMKALREIKEKKIEPIRPEIERSARLVGRAYKRV